MAAGINVLLILTAMHLIKPMPTTENLNDSQNNTNVDTQEIYEDLEEHINFIKNVIADLQKIKITLNKNKMKIKEKLYRFKMNLLDDEEFFKTEEEMASDRRRCNNYGGHCDTTCSEHILIKTVYNRSIEVFSKLLLINFEEKFHIFKFHLDDILNEMDTIKMLATVEFNLNETNNLINFKKELFEKIDKLKTNLFNIAKELLISYQKLSKNEIEFQMNLLKEINDKKLAYACCIKNFNYEIDGLICNPPKLNDDDYIDTSLLLQSGENRVRYPLIRRN